MLIRGGNRLTVHTSGGLGFSDLDFERPDLSPARLGYVYVGGVPVGPDPAQPYFVSVQAASGVINVVVACTEMVDGFELSWNTTSNTPDLANLLYNSSGVFTVPTNTACYLFARSVRDGRRSVWTSYGDVPPDFSDMETIKDDDLDGYSADAAYPGLLHLFGTSGDYIKIYVSGTPDCVQCHQSANPASFSVFTTASGIQLTRFGGRYTFKAEFRKYGAPPTETNNQFYGVIFRARSQILSSYTGETYYVLAIRRYDNSTIYAYLYTGSGSTLTQVAISGNIESYFPTATEFYEVQYDLNGDTFTITKTATGDVVFTATDTTIAASDDRVYTGLYLKATGSGSTPRISDNLLIEKRTATGNPSEVDPGEYYDGLEADTLDVVFNLSSNAHWQCSNTGADYCRVAYDNDTLPVLYRYNAAGTLAATTDLVTGNGTANKVAKFSAVQTVADSSITDNGTTVTIESAVVINDAGADKDTRIEGDNDANLFFVDASADKVGISTNAPTIMFSMDEKVGFTPDGGLAVQVVAGENVVRGNVVYVKIASGADGKVWKTVASDGEAIQMPVGVVYANASADAAVWIVTGGIAYVLPESGITATRGNVLVVSNAEDGVVEQSATTPTTEHWREVGHWLDTGSGNGALTRAFIHFN